MGNLPGNDAVGDFGVARLSPEQIPLNKTTIGYHYQCKRIGDNIAAAAAAARCRRRGRRTNVPRGYVHKAALFTAGLIAIDAVELHHGR